jgi:cullin-associated NEDD8-dissociated protein 1
MLGDAMGADLPRCLKLLLDRLKNEITRLAAVKAIGAVATSELNPPMGESAAAATVELAGFLRKTNRPLRQASLFALDALVSKHAGSLSDAEVTAAVEEASALVSDGDLALASAALSLSASAVSSKGRAPFANACSAVCEKTLPAALELVRSPLMQSHALHALTSFFTALVSAKLSVAGASSDDLLARLMGSGDGSNTGEAAATAGRTAAVCVAAVCAGVGDAKHTASTASSLVAQLGDPASMSEKDLLALFCLGELGKAADLSAVAGIEAALLGALDVPGEELKSAASVALGGVATRGRAKFLPIILGHVSNESHKHQYSLFLSLREVIRNGGVDRTADADRTLDILFANAGSEDEGVRNVVAECLGLLAVNDAESLVPRLAEKVTGGDAKTRATAVLAVKYAVLSLGAGDDGALGVVAGVLPAFVGSIPCRDEDLDVRRAAVQTLSAAAHANPTLARPIFSDALPAVFEQTAIDKSLVRIVDLGPFKHTVDDGLELRKAAFECCDTLLDACLPGEHESVAGAASGYAEVLVTGLGDHYDVKMTSHALFAKLAARQGAHAVLLGRLKELVDPMAKTLTQKLKSDAVKQEIDRNEDLIRSCLRAVHACEVYLTGAANNPAFVEFIAKTVNGEKTAAKYAAVKAEAKAADKE